jgi:hypothetical protein
VPNSLTALIALALKCWPVCQIRFNFSCLNILSEFKIEVLIVLAPKLPPTTKTVRLLFSILKSFFCFF